MFKIYSDSCIVIRVIWETSKHMIAQVSLDNLDTIGEALLHENFFDIILPIFQNND